MVSTSCIGAIRAVRLRVGRRRRLRGSWSRLPGAADGLRRRMRGLALARHDALVARREHVDDQRVVHRAAPLVKDRERVLVGHAPAVRAIRGQRVEAVDDREDARADGDVGAADAIGIARAVPVLVVMPDDRHDGIRKIDRREDLRANRRVELHLLVFGRRELAGLVEDVLGNRDLAGVVQQRGSFDRLQASRSSLTPSSRARPMAPSCTRRMCPCVTSSLASIAVASVSTVDR